MVESPYSSKIKITLPSAADIHDYVSHQTADGADFEASCEVSRDELANELVGLSRANVRSVLLHALSGARPIAVDYLTGVKKAHRRRGRRRVEFIETQRTLDDVAGHDEASHGCARTPNSSARAS